MSISSAGVCRQNSFAGAILGNSINRKLKNILQSNRASHRLSHAVVIKQWKHKTFWTAVLASAEESIHSARAQTSFSACNQERKTDELQVVSHSKTIWPSLAIWYILRKAKSAFRFKDHTVHGQWLTITLKRHWSIGVVKAPGVDTVDCGLSKAKEIEKNTYYYSSCTIAQTECADERMMLSIPDLDNRLRQRRGSKLFWVKWLVTRGCKEIVVPEGSLNTWDGGESQPKLIQR